MTTPREAVHQALAFTMRDFATVRDFEAARAVLHDTLRAALEQPSPDAIEQAQAHAEAFSRGHDAGWQSAAAHYAALEQPEQEPVAWMYVGLTFNNDMHGPHLVWKPEHMDAMSAEKGVVASPLYTHPPRREWRGLTEEEFWPMLEAEGRADRKPVEIIAAFARAIEAALKEKNHD